MLNFKAKSHRGRSALNHAESPCVVETRKSILRAFAVVIPNKLSATLVPIIMNQVESNSIIWTDEHKSYACLKNFNYTHGTVCHKYEFVNSETGVNTQAIESFHNELKLEIKRRKGVLNDNRPAFLREFCFFLITVPPF